MKLNILTFLLLITTSISFGQKKFTKGFYITSSNEKIVGYFNLDELFETKSFEYYTDEEKNKKTILENNFKEIALEDDTYFFLKTVDIDSNRKLGIDTNYAVLDVLLEKKTVALERLSLGDKSLFCTKINNIYYYYLYDKNSEKLTYLVYNEYLNNSTVIENNSYRNFLFNELKCDANLNKSSFENLRYSESSLIKIFNKYNSCNGSYVKKNNESSKIKYGINAIFGAKLYDINIIPVGSYLRQTISQNVITPSIGIEFSMRKLNDLIFLRTSIEKVAFEKTQINRNNNSVSYNSYDRIKYENTFLNANVGYRKYLNKFYIDGSFESTFSFNGKLSYDLTSDLNSKMQEFSKPFTGDYALNFGIGYQYKKFTIEAKYSTIKNVLNFGGFYLTDKTNYLNMNIMYSIL